MTWFAVENDLIGGYAVSAQDKPLSQTDSTNDPDFYVVADFMEESDARVIADLLNFHNFVPAHNWRRDGGPRREADHG